MIMSMILEFNSQQLKATVFLSVVSILGLSALLLFVLSIRAQKKYNTDALPSLNGFFGDDENDMVEETPEETGSAFHIDDDSSLPGFEEFGDQEAENLLRDTRSAQHSTPKKTRKSLFKKKL